MIVSTVDLFCYYPIDGADKEIKYGLKHIKHCTKESNVNKALHSFIVYKDCYRIFFDQWQDSDMIQKKFLDKVVVPDVPELPSNCKRFHYNNINEATNYIQQLTGEKFYPMYTTSKFKKNDVLKELRPAILKKFEQYNEKLGLEDE
jgi:hypothetical protein